MLFNQNYWSTSTLKFVDVDFQSCIWQKCSDEVICIYNTVPYVKKKRTFYIYCRIYLLCVSSFVFYVYLTMSIAIISCHLSTISSHFLKILMNNHQRYIISYLLACIVYSPVNIKICLRFSVSCLLIMQVFIAVAHHW